MNASDILDAIARKHRDCALIREVLVTDQDADRFASADAWVAAGRPGKMPRFEPTARRIDGLLFNGGQIRTAIEVKISRADYQRENDAKRRPWIAVTNRFVYATPAGLLRPDEIPDGCGLWEVDDAGRVTIARRARINRDPDPIPHQVLVALAYRLHRKAAA
ncbi:hypothetical protein [Rhodococcus sp. YH1]|uniref:hypothetical protein n=1 Tax=Rhodococcus sp. YH1 TaxID=89066 RepID=UPI0013870475|nr:hypothetical protein [Rhodococcus sp. YH1]